MLTRLLAVAVACLILGASATSAAASPGLVGQWKLDEGAGTLVADSSGQGHNGVLSGAGAGWAPGMSGSALGFDGVSGEVIVPASASLEPAAGVSVSAWVKATGSPGDHRYVVAKGATGCIAASYGLYSGPNGGLQFYVSERRGTVYARSPDAGTRVWDGNWHLAVGTFDATTIRLYVDGTEVGSGTTYPGLLEYLLGDSNDLFIGNYPGCSQHEFRGLIDDVRIWNRALTAAQVSGLEPSQTPGGQPIGNPGGGGGNVSGGGGNVSGGGGTAPATTNSDRRPPEIQRAKLSSPTLTVGPGGLLIGADRHGGVTISYTATEPARMTIAVLRSQAGRRRGGQCVTHVAWARGRRGAPCTRFVVIGSFTRNDPAGRVTVRLSGLLTRHRLSPGIYRLDLTPRAHGKNGTTVSVAFRVRRQNA
jgi:hypothetical protein